MVIARGFVLACMAASASGFSISAPWADGFRGRGCAHRSHPSGFGIWKGTSSASGGLRGAGQSRGVSMQAVLPPQSPMALSKKTPRTTFQVELPRPLGLILEASSGTAAAAASDWEDAVDEETGKTYFWNTQTQETSWDEPADAAAGGGGGAVFVAEIAQGASAEASRGLVLEGDVIVSVGGEDFAGSADLQGVMDAIGGWAADPVPLTISRDESIVAVTFDRDRAYAARVGEPLRSVATRAKASVQYSCEGGTCGTCEHMSQGTGMYARVCTIPLVPAMVGTVGEGGPPGASFTK